MINTLTKNNTDSKIHSLEINHLMELNESLNDVPHNKSLQRDSEEIKTSEDKQSLGKRGFVPGEYSVTDEHSVPKNEDKKVIITIYLSMMACQLMFLSIASFFPNY